MKNKITFLFILFQFIIIHAIHAGNDSLFINDVKEFAFKEIGIELKGDFYTQWDKEKKPYLYVYVSLPALVGSPPDLNTSFIYCGTDESLAQKKESEYMVKGYSVFCYKTYANSATLLNERFITYRKETKCFIVFHELMHNYIHQNKLDIPYEFNEAICDVLGNYGALKYAIDSSKTDLRIAKEQIEINEKIYSVINSTISKIAAYPERVMKFNKRCQKKIRAILLNADLFQMDRFDYEVSNAYLLKNLYYSKEYFLLQEVFLKQGTIKEFLEIIKNLPQKSFDCETYLEKYL